jgi:hypothetical protein
MSFLISSGRELENRVSGKISNLGNFIDERMETGFTRPLVDLVEIVVGVYLPPFVQRSPEMTALVEATVEHVTWVNDIQSWNKEQLASDPHNIVTVLRHHEGCSLAEAVDRTTERLAKNIHTFLEMEERLFVRFPDFVGDLRRFTGGVRRLLIGHCLWYGQTERYRVLSPVEPCGTLTSFVEPVLVTTYARSA